MRSYISGHTFFKVKTQTSPSPSALPFSLETFTQPWKQNLETQSGSEAVPPAVQRGLAGIRKQQSGCSVTDGKNEEIHKETSKTQQGTRAMCKRKIWELKHYRTERKLNRSSDGSVRRGSESSQMQKALFCIELVDTKGGPNVKTGERQNQGAVREGKSESNMRSLNFSSFWEQQTCYICKVKTSMKLYRIN